MQRALTASFRLLVTQTGMIQIRVARQRRIQEEDMGLKAQPHIKDGNSLVARFDEAVEYFNNPTAPNQAKLQAMLHNDVILKRVDHPALTDLVQGPANVIQYLKSEWTTDQPQFHPQAASKHADPILGSVHGLAIWQETGKPDDQIRYFFLFDQDQASGVWTILFIYGSTAL
jgi:hypothetical protein